MSAKKRVLIAGAGIGGLTTALACLRRGMDVEVFEQAPVLGEVGAGIQIGPTGLRVLAALGLEEALRECWFVPEMREMRVWNTGYCASTPAPTSRLIDLYGFPNVMLHRADLHEILVEAIRAIAPNSIHTNARAMRFEQTASNVTLLLESGESVTGDILVGADGLHSNVRKQLFGVSKPHFTGCIAWRGIVPSEKVSPALRIKCSQNWMGTDGHFVVYPIRGGKFINIVGHIERDDWQVESWTEQGTHEEIAADFKGWHPDILALIASIETPFKWAMFLHSPLGTWSEGRVTLLGDSCHPTLPYLASGANMAIEDGMVLARCLEATPDDIEGALKRYEAMRIPRTTKIVNESAANQHRFHHQDLASAATASAYIEGVAAAQLNLRDWVFDYDATSVALPV